MPVLTQTGETRKLYGAAPTARLCTDKDNYLCIDGMQCWPQNTVFMIGGGAAIILLFLIILVSK